MTLNLCFCFVFLLAWLAQIVLSTFAQGSYNVGAKFCSSRETDFNSDCWFGGTNPQFSTKRRHKSGIKTLRSRSTTECVAKSCLKLRFFVKNSFTLWIEDCSNKIIFWKLLCFGLRIRFFGNRPAGERHHYDWLFTWANLCTRRRNERRESPLSL